MGERIQAVMIYDQREPSGALRKVLKRLDMDIHHVRTCREASQLFKQPNSAELVFTDTNLPDGTWADVLRSARQADPFLAVIVVSRVVDIDLYLEALQSGAFDFVTPPFLTYELANVIGSAVYQKLLSRDLQQTRVA
jgi:DNA-binding NtrC family response regulator